MHRRPALLAAVAVVALLLASCSSPEPSAVVVDRDEQSGGGPAAGGAPGGPTSGDVGPDDPAAHASLTAWEPCDDGFECATLTVPLDWSDEDGDTVDLAVARLPAGGGVTDSLLVNPGGPGASGIDFLRGFAVGGLPDGLADAFDVVSWDPRGTGRSAPIDCTSDEEWLEPEIDPTPDDHADIDAIRAQAEEAVDACVTEAGDRLALVGTRATARDLDALRGALGDERLTYVGYSYGTTIGLEYLRLYPDRVRAMVLDGVAVPGVDPIEDTRSQAEGFERALDAYLDDCPDRPTCRLGPDPKGALLGLVADLEQRRIPASYTLQGDDAVREGTLGVGELYIAVASALYTEASWPVLDQGLDEALGQPTVGITLLALRDDYLGRQPDGTWQDDTDARAAIRCADQVERSDQPEGDTDLADGWTSDLPFWGAWFAAGLPGCWGLPEAVDPLLPLDEGAITDAPPVVLIGTTNDPATPYEQSVAAQQVVAGSRLITYVGDEHTAYRSLSACVDAAATAYLVDLEVPPADLTCTD